MTIEYFNCHNSIFFFFRILHYVNKREKAQETFELPVKKNTEDTTTPEVQPIEYINKSFIAEENK